MAKYGLRITPTVISNQRYLWFKEFKSGKKLEKSVYEMKFSVRDGETATFFYRSIEAGNIFKPLVVIKEKNTYSVRTLGNCIVFMFTDRNIDGNNGTYGASVKEDNREIWESNEIPLRMLKQVLLPPYGNGSTSERYANTGKCIAIQPLGSRVYAMASFAEKKIWLYSDIFSTGTGNRVLAQKFAIFNGVSMGGVQLENDLMIVRNLNAFHPIFDGISLDNPVTVNVIDVTEILETFNLSKEQKYV